MDNLLELRMNRAIVAMLIVFIALMCSCNNAKHMERVYPDGYYVKGRYLKNHKPSYQIYCTQDSMYIADGSRAVFVLPYDSSVLSTTILNDNQ